MLGGAICSSIIRRPKGDLQAPALPEHPPPRMKPLKARSAVDHPNMTLQSALLAQKTKRLATLHIQKIHMNVGFPSVPVVLKAILRMTLHIPAKPVNVASRSTYPLKQVAPDVTIRSHLFDGIDNIWNTVLSQVNVAGIALAIAYAGKPAFAHPANLPRKLG